MSGLGLYVHWPYCARLCPYCDFNVYRQRGRDSEPLVAAMLADLRAQAALMPSRRLDTIYFGGGTPSLLAPRSIAQVIETAAACFDLASDAEISLEANPEDRACFADFAAAGVNRLSIGVLALDDAALRALGRNHDAAAARAAVDAAAAAGARVSLDLIYARADQGVAQWRAELREALALPAEHYSLYQLTIEAGTAFDRAVRRGRLHPPSNEQAADFYEATQEICEAAGAPAYEVSNHARGEAARSRHNLLYWRGAEWLGIGPGAHGRMTIEGRRLATKAPDAIDEYLAAAAKGPAWETRAALDDSEIAAEAVLMGLRVEEGVDRAAAERWRGRAFDEAALTAFARQGFLRFDSARIALTPAGRLVADRIALALCG